MQRARGTLEMPINIWVGSLKGRDDLEDLRIKFSDMGLVGVDWIHLAKDWERCRAPLKTAISTNGFTDHVPSFKPVLRHVRMKSQKSLSLGLG